MKKEQKAQVVDELKEAITKCSTGILTDYKGMSSNELNILRRKMRELGIEYRVVKNTLARFAAEKAGKDFLVASFEGPVAIAFGYDEVIKPAKALMGYIRTSDSKLNIKGGFLGDRLLNEDEVKALATIPPREVLIAQVLAEMQGTIVALLNCLTHPLREVSGVLKARIKQLEGE